MGVINYGTQTISFDFREPGKSENFNKLNHKILEPGIYDGGLLSYADATHINLAPFLAYIEDTDTEVSVRVETAEVVNLLVAPSAPYCILRFNWNNTTNNYADVLMSAEIDIEADDLIIGRIIYDATTLETFFDYSRKSVPVITTSIAEKLEFIVRPQEPYDKTVSIQGGTINNGIESITVPSGSSPTISDTILGRTDIVYMLPSGAFNVIEGEDSASPETPNYGTGYVLCEIHRGAGKTYITGADITMVSDDKFTADNLLKTGVENKIATQKTVTIPKNITQAYTNLVQDPTDLTTASWNAQNGTTAIASDRTINGYPLTKILCDGTLDPQIEQQNMPVTASVKHTAHIIINRGNTTGTSQLFLILTGVNNSMSIIWDTKTLNVIVGDSVFGNWIDDDTVEIWFTTTDTSVGTLCEFRVDPPTSATNGEFIYVTACQLVDNTTTMFPFVDGSKEADIIDESFTMPDKFTFDMIIEPKFQWDTSAQNMELMCFYIDNSNRLLVFYEENEDNFQIYWSNGVANANLRGQIFDDGSSFTNINQKIRVIGSLNLSSGGQDDSRLIVIPIEEGILFEDSSWNTTPDIALSNFDTLFIGNANMAAEYEYLRIYDGLLVGDVTESSDVDTILQSQTLLFDASIDEFKETKIDAGTPVSLAIEMLAEDVKTGVAIQDKAIINRHLDDSLAEKVSFVNQDVKDTASPEFSGIVMDGYELSIGPLGNPFEIQSQAYSVSASTRTSIENIDKAHIAIINDDTSELQTYEWNGTQWNTLGSSLSITSADRMCLTKLNTVGTVTYMVHAFSYNLETYSWDSSTETWAKVGNTLTIGTAYPNITTLSDTEIALCGYSASSNLLVYEWSGTDWSLVTTNTMDPAQSAPVYITHLGNGYIIVFSNSTDSFLMYSWNGTDTWTYIDAFAMGQSEVVVGLTALTSHTFACASGATEALKIYEWSEKFIREIWSVSVSSLNYPEIGNGTPNTLVVADEGTLALQTFSVPLGLSVVTENI